MLRFLKFWKLRRIKLSGILKLFSATIPANRPDSLKEFFETFSDSPRQDNSTIDDLEPYSYSLIVFLKPLPYLIHLSYNPLLSSPAIQFTLFTKAKYSVNLRRIQLPNICVLVVCLF